MFKRISSIVIVLTAVILLAGCQGNWKPEDDNGKIIFYYSLTCPHCKNVEKYVADNDVKAKVDFIEKEVSKNQNNAKSFADKITKCEIKPEEAGVPLLWDGEKEICLLGDEKIIGYFFQKMKDLESNQ